MISWTAPSFWSEINSAFAEKMRIRAAFIGFAVLTATPACGWQVKLLEQPLSVESVEYGDVVSLRNGNRLWQLHLDNGSIQPFRIESKPRQSLEPDALPDTAVVASQVHGGILYFAQPTKKYAHGVLGDAIEAGALVLLRPDGTKVSMQAGANAVFEDLTPRLYDLDRNGIAKIIVVKSYLDRGAALAVIGQDKSGGLAILTETPPVGSPNRWLNPAGVGDFLGTGAQEIALVRMPHALGRLEIWRWGNGALTKVSSVTDTSNHAIGSRSLNLSVVFDFDGDGAADLAIPSFDRRAIRILRFRGGVAELARISLPARAERGMALISTGKETVIVVGLEDGRVALIRK